MLIFSHSSLLRRSLSSSGMVVSLSTCHWFSFSFSIHCLAIGMIFLTLFLRMAIALSLKDWKAVCGLSCSVLFPSYWSREECSLVASLVMSLMICESRNSVGFSVQHPLPMNGILCFDILTDISWWSVCIGEGPISHSSLNRSMFS